MTGTVRMSCPFLGAVIDSSCGEPPVGSIVLRPTTRGSVYPWRRDFDAWYAIRSEIPYTWVHVGAVPVTVVHVPSDTVEVGVGWPTVGDATL
jgi:hypothetical protein